MSLKEVLPSLSTGMCLACAAVFSLATHHVNAQAKLYAPGGWQSYNWGTDHFNDYDIGWQWNNNAPNWFLFEESKSGPYSLSKFRTQNVVMTGDHVRLINWYHYTPVTEQGRTFTYSGGWLQSKATWLTEGQFQAQTKVDWNFGDIWPSFWTTYASGGGGDELDIMEYQSNILNHAHHVWSNGNSNSPSKRLWTPWMNPRWHHTWAMERVRSWSNWACRTTRNTQATFYINGKLEHTSNKRKVVSPMIMHFSTSPHRDHRPAPGNYPDFRVNWVETHIP
ncbi:hypothetical protein [Coraliomargarita akajimensis]|uniref:GH16 domain-containing protein n=1 Tax=Coraliomargarita akajimensis (strain DSM 45221 / IAM 15411 / JCM 23193 / KCTC 12865 / 04OKA010-24) TaxID=583355 RepID=D5EHJ7_CORAD|nr:hypothetical protein [Coraliomargarita akajimensis]ADE54038.1 hypothetical protein Caka_1016 [Coraliomargarita akajimensis DSM 45221]